MRDIIKLSIIALLASIAIPIAGHAATVQLAWDGPVTADLPNVKATIIYDVLGSTRTEVARVVCSGSPNVCPGVVSFNAIIGPHNWIAVFNDGFQDSADSNTVATPTGNPKNLRKQ